MVGGALGGVWVLEGLGFTEGLFDGIPLLGSEPIRLEELERILGSLVLFNTKVVVCNKTANVKWCKKRLNL